MGTEKTTPMPHGGIHATSGGSKKVPLEKTSFQVGKDLLEKLLGQSTEGVAGMPVLELMVTPV